MKTPAWFRPKQFVIALVACAVISGGAALLLDLNFWVLFVLLFASMLVNGVLATLEDRRRD